MNKMIYDYDIFTERKCAVCDKIDSRNAPYWRFAANLPFHYVCSDKCADDLKVILTNNKSNKS